MSKKSMTRYKDVDTYVQEIEEVYDVSLEFDFTPIVRMGQPMCYLTVKAYDKDDSERSTGPIAYHRCECPTAQTYRREQSIKRALTDITYQCLQSYTQK